MNGWTAGGNSRWLSCPCIVLDLYDRFLVLDSDNYFIRDFAERDIFGGPDEMRIVATTENYAYAADPEIDALALGSCQTKPEDPPNLRFGPGAQAELAAVLPA